MRKSAPLILLLLACTASPAQQASAPNQSSSSPTLKVDVKLVNVYVTVTDAQGGPVAGLKKDNFTLQEDGHDQTIAVFDKESAVPLSIALAIDTSLSTRHDLAAGTGFGQAFCAYDYAAGGCFFGFWI